MWARYHLQAAVVGPTLVHRHEHTPHVGEQTAVIVPVPVGAELEINIHKYLAYSHFHHNGASNTIYNLVTDMHPSSRQTSNEHDAPDQETGA